MTDARREWERKNTVRLNLKFQKSTDGDIIDYLERQESKQAIIKDALREKMAREKVQT